ncbi:MAG TPA: TIGR03435 family protein [Vicinamibacterales bacterium]|nr:TIGR03435 family protein [Vicinamibacterales bacterium]
MFRRFAVLAMGLACVGAGVHAQQSSQPKFEVASIKPSDPFERRTMFDMPTTGRFRAVGVNLKLLVARAFSIQLTQIAGGPAWLESDRFDIEAKAAGVPAGIDGYREMMRMLQTLLEERFSLKVHSEVRQDSIYELVVSKGGAKLKEAKPNEPTQQQMGRGQLAVTATSMSQLLPILSPLTARQVVDKTGLDGLYDFTLTFALEASRPDAPLPVDPSAPSIFTAIQEQLGLKLESARGPVDVLVIDRAEKPTLD